MQTTYKMILSIIILTGLSACASNRTPYNSDYSYSGRIYPGTVSHVSYGSDFGQGYGLNHGTHDYQLGYGIDDYGIGYANVDYGTAGEGPVGYGDYDYKRWGSSVTWGEPVREQ